MSKKDEIEALRGRLVAAVDEHGLKSDEVLDISQEMDILHNSFNQDKKLSTEK
ncbi:aspartyl-phosphate phosphatase Spo0E family protein [Paenibacillus glucanolyticus]|jgi:hypothetical protein|uniref:aspartyl-phosphate phosphatase Spo0E family protein n=1 Tax=Paenibacillus TaxID=44249 RepID=UPI0009ED41A8|nr:aspartyl-phosphate phosphatase Spo0E family protein [Paenibacillus glucanolyticus]